MKDKKKLTDSIAELFKKNSDDITAEKVKKLSKKFNNLSDAEQTNLIFDLANALGIDNNARNEAYNEERNVNFTDIQKIAQNYIVLSKYVIEKAKVKGATALRAELNDGCFTVYALNPAPFELDFPRYVSSDNPQMEELSYEIDALLSDISFENDAEEKLKKIKDIIDTAVL